MGMNDKEFCDKVHMLIHSLRLITKYNPTEAEKKLSQWVIEKYSNECSECRERGLDLSNVKPKENIFKKLGGMLDNA